VAYNSVTIFIHLAVVAAQIFKIPRKTRKIRTPSSSRLSEVSILVLIESAYATFY